MFCTSCGHQLIETNRFCPQCGTPAGPDASRPAFSPQSGRRLVRSMSDKTIAGVCSGFAHYLDIDVTLMRIIWLCTAVFTGVGFIAYLVCWIVMPKDYGPAAAAVEQPPAQAHPASRPAESKEANSEARHDASPA